MTTIISLYSIFVLSIAYYIYGSIESFKGFLGTMIIVPGVALTYYFLSVLSILYFLK